MSTVLVTFHDEKYKPLAEYTLFKNKKEYCEKHGYHLVYADDGGNKISGLKMAPPPVPEGCTFIGLGRMYLALDAMKKYPESEWILTMDCDTMVTNMKIKVEHIIETYKVDKNIHVLVPADINGINIGVMLIRNSKIGKAFVETVISAMPAYDDWYLYENQLIQDLIVGSHLEEHGIVPGGTLWAKKAMVLPQRVMNSYPYADLPLLKNRKPYNDIIGTNGQWKEGDFVVQWPSVDLDFRISAAKAMLDKVVC